MLVDAHQHYWRPERGDYDWMSAAPASLRQPFTPIHLRPQLDALGISRTILVQAAPTVAESDYLLGIADAVPTVAGVVGWIDFEQAGQRRELERLAAHPRLVGIRPMVQDLPDDDWILRPAFAWAIAALQELGLAFDALGRPRHARRFLTMCQRHPDLRVVLDHGLKPPIASGGFEPWASDMRDLARHTGAYCKLSGLATEASPDAAHETLRPYVDLLLECFGPARLMWGSDWPVATTAIGYREWFDACQRWLAPLGEQDRARVFGANALDFYQAW